MRALRWFGCVFLTLIALLLLVPGFYIAFTTDWQPTRELRGEDVARIRAASSFVESFKASKGRLPTWDEFGRWTKTAPDELRLEGVGFDYEKHNESTYIFAWYGGRGAWLWWKSNSGLDRANLSSQNYFIFGSKLADLVVFFGFAAAALWGARLAAPVRKHAS